MEIACSCGGKGDVKKCVCVTERKVACVGRVEHRNCRPKQRMFCKKEHETRLVLDPFQGC